MHPSQDITIDNLMLDCSRRGGGLSLDNVLRAHLFHLYVVHYTTVGIAVSKGHEVHIESGFLGEWIWGEDGRSKSPLATENLPENTDGAPRGGGGGGGAPPL